MTATDVFRRGVGIVLANGEGAVLWAKRLSKEAWQFPQGGIEGNENIEQALYRELAEEVGLRRGDVEILGSTKGWLTYFWPENVLKKPRLTSRYIGQKQKWFLLRLKTKDVAINLKSVHPAEFEKWCWVDYWYPLDHVVDFKRQAYQQALKELSVYL